MTKAPRRILWTSTTAYFVLAGAALVVLLVWGAIARQRAQTRAVTSIPVESRAQLYQRALSNLQLCNTQSSEGLEGFCSAEATLILAFPECDEACQLLARRFVSRPTR
jgi:hypothetical protein